MLTLDGPAFDQMKVVEREIARVLTPHREKTEAALCVFALLRCARVLLRLYPKRTQQELLPVLVGYLQGKTDPTQSAAQDFLITQ